MTEEPIPVVLSRFRITGAVDEETPRLILLDIADAHGILLDKSRENEEGYLLNAVRTSPIPIAVFPFGSNDMSMIATFVNRHAEWPSTKLLEAFTYLMGFIDQPATIITEVTTEFIYGNQTPSHVRSLNPCVLYKICKGCKYSLPYDISLDQLATIVYMLAENTDKARCLLYQQTASVDKEGIISMFIASCEADHESEEYVVTDVENNTEVSTLKSTPISYDSIKIAAEAFKNPSYLLARIRPLNSAEAITLAAVNFKIDVSQAADPLLEYEVMRVDATRYIPADHNLKKAVQSNPYFLDLNTNFNPSLPSEVYSEADLNHLAELEGYSQQALQQDSAYTLLQAAYLSDTFYHGKLPTIFNTKFHIYRENVDDELNENIVCYGVKDLSVIAYTYVELADLFATYKNFTNPLATSEVFSSLAINKLEKLCLLRRSGESGECIEARDKLFRAIGAVRAYQLDKNLGMLALNDLHKSSPQMKEYIETTLKLLLEASMYMRGWRGVGKYPIEEATVNTPDAELVSTASLEALHRFDRYLETLPSKLSNLLLSLPLYKYMGEFIVSSDEHEGLTLGDRLCIVRGGERNNNMASCIRFSSNWLATSAYMYMLVVGLPLPFAVEKLRHIS